MFKHWQSHSTKKQIHVKTIKFQIYTQVKAVKAGHINSEKFLSLLLSSLPSHPLGILPSYSTMHKTRF